MSLDWAENTPFTIVHRHNWGSALGGRQDRARRESVLLRREMVVFVVVDSRGRAACMTGVSGWNWVNPRVSKWITSDGHNETGTVTAHWRGMMERPPERLPLVQCGTAIWNLYGVGLWCHALPQARNFTSAIHSNTHLISTTLARLGMAFLLDNSWLFPLASNTSVGTGCRSRRSPRQWRFDKSRLGL